MLTEKELLTRSIKCYLDRGADKSFHDVHVDVRDIVPDDEVIDVLPHLVRAVEADLIIIADVEEQAPRLRAAAK